MVKGRPEPVGDGSRRREEAGAQTGRPSSWGPPGLQAGKGEAEAGKGGRRPAPRWGDASGRRDAEGACPGGRWLGQSLTRRARRGAGGHSPSWRRPGAVGAAGGREDGALRPGSAARESRCRRPSRPPRAAPPALPFARAAPARPSAHKTFFFFSNFLGGPGRANGRRGSRDKQRPGLRASQWERGTGRGRGLRDGTGAGGGAAAGGWGRGEGAGRGRRRRSARVRGAEGAVRPAGDFAAHRAGVRGVAPRRLGYGEPPGLLGTWAKYPMLTT